MGIDLLGWVDVETTGLDVENDVILEIGIIITDGSLKEIASSPAVICSAEKASLDAMNDFVRDMHTKSGLIGEVSWGGCRINEAEDLLLDFLYTFAEPGQVPMAGSSIGSLDRPMLRKYMPRLHDWFSYRNVDVSSFKEMMFRWAPYVVENRPEEDKGHRVLSDIRDSIKELRHYKTWIDRGLTNTVWV